MRSGSTRDGRARQGLRQQPGLRRLLGAENRPGDPPSGNARREARRAQAALLRAWRVAVRRSRLRAERDEAHARSPEREPCRSRRNRRPSPSGILPARCPRSPRPPTWLSFWAGRLRLRIAVISTRWPAASPKMRPSTGGRWGTTSRGGRPFAASLRTGLARTRSWSSGLRKSATSAMGLCLPWSFRTVVRLAAPVTFDSARDGSSSGCET